MKLIVKEFIVSNIKYRWNILIIEIFQGKIKPTPAAMVDFSEREKGEGGYDRTVNVTFVFFLLFYARILKYKIPNFMIENTRLFLPSFENLIIWLMMMMHPL